MSRRVRIPLLLTAFYVALPLGDLPGIGLSLSAPLVAWILVETLAAPDRLPRGPWIGLTLLLWTGLAASLAVNVLTGAIPGVASDEWLLLARFAYWGALFVAVAGWLSRAEWTRDVAAAIGLGAGVLGLLRLAEAARDGVWGAGNPQWLSQNDYGFGFSTFTPFLLWTAFAGPRSLRLIALALTPATLLAVVGNGSRSSWIAVAVGACLLVALTVASGRLRVWTTLAAASAAALLLSAGAMRVTASPAEVLESDVLAGPRARWESLGRLDADKPFRTRLLLVDKGLQLFERSPWVGVGLGRFAKESAEPSGLADAAWLNRDQLNERTPHNAYVKILGETGLAGTVPLLLLLGLAAWRGPGAALRSARLGETWAAAAVAAGAGMSLHLWTMSGLTGTGPWLVLGLIAAAVERDRRRARTGAPA